MHTRLLFDVIQRQAGTLAKAVLEGVMNSIDAGASKVTLSADADKVTISDDGKGFRSRKEIEEWFEVFGQPHEEGENKVYGTFRMGRGQLLAHGVNAWRTGKFEMDVDIKDKGLDYHLTEVAKAVPGCSIEIELYEKLSRVGLRELEEDLKRMVKWAAVPITLNGFDLSQDPAKAKWQIEDDLAYYNFKDTGSLAVYNLGVRACDWGAYKFGLAGEVVSKKQLKLNFARNDVMNDCPAWKEIRKVIDNHSSRQSRKKKASLNDGQRAYLIRQLLSDMMEEEEIGDLQLLTDVAGRHLSFDDLR